MLSIVENQKTEDAIIAGGAFRQAYHITKLIKAWLWGVTFLLAILQVLAAIINKDAIDLTFLSVLILCIYVVFGCVGKSYMLNMQSLGCSIQQMHDYLTMNVGRIPNEFDLPPSKVKRLSDSWFSHDLEARRQELSTWWNINLARVSFPQARLICCCSTFYWEVELRRKYQLFLTCIFFLSVLFPFLVSICMQFSVTQMLVFTLAPFTPFVSLVFEEWLANKSCLKSAEKIRHDCHDVWKKVIDKTIDDASLMADTNTLMDKWQSYRLTTLPIFDWLYRVTRCKMEEDMLVDSDALIESLNRKK